MNRRLATFALVAVCLLSVRGVTAKDKSPDVVYVPTPHDIVAKMLEVAGVKKDDVVYDLGCGDGRIVVTAAKKIGCRGVGFEISPEMVKASNANVKRAKVENLVTIKQEDIFKQDLSKASVITLYLLPSLNLRLVPQFEKMKPGSRIVSHAYDIKGIKPDRVISIESKEDSSNHNIYLWTIPLKKEEKKEKPREKPKEKPKVKPKEKKVTEL